MAPVLSALFAFFVKPKGVALMKLKFTKMHGCGNDYIYFNCFEQTIENPEELAVKLSDRHFSIGGDGIVLICPSDMADAKMRMFNIDGSEGKMCGNAIRCIGKYLHDNGISGKNPLKIETLSGIKTLELNTDESDKVTSVRVDMGKAVLKPSEIPVKLDGDTAIARQVNIGGLSYKITCVSMGNPHCVVFTDTDVEDIELEKIGPVFEKCELFPEQVNTEFINVIGKNELKMRVWERGSGETLACGTGACASAVAACLCGYAEKGKDVKVRLIGGDLTINYTDKAVYMTGGAEAAFTGEVEV